MADLTAALRESYLVDTGIADSLHNRKAKILRRGLGIVSFNALEDFLCSRIGEAFDYICATNTRFENLTDRLQKASTLDALSAIHHRANIARSAGEDWLRMVQDETCKIHSSRQTPFRITHFSLFSKSSNISSSDVSDSLSALGISGGWKLLDDIAKRMLTGLVSGSQGFTNLASRRHNAAHKADFNYEFSWLEVAPTIVLGVAAAFDVAICQQERNIHADPTSAINQHSFDGQMLKFRFIESENGLFKERVHPRGRAIRNWKTIEDARTGVLPRVIQNREFLVFIDASGRFFDWEARH